MLSLALGQVGINPWEFWRLTFTEFAYLVDNYYHKRDLQTKETREILAMIYNVNRTKGPAKEGSDFMLTIEESLELQEKKKEVPEGDLAEKVRQKYGGQTGGI